MYAFLSNTGMGVVPFCDSGENNDGRDGAAGVDAFAPVLARGGGFPVSLAAVGVDNTSNGGLDSAIAVTDGLRVSVCGDTESEG